MTDGWIGLVDGWMIFNVDDALEVHAFSYLLNV